MQISVGTVKKSIIINEAKTGGAGGSTRNAAINLASTFGLTNGTGVNQVDEYWDDTRTIGAVSGQVANPGVAPAPTASGSGATIPTATYYVGYTFVGSAGVLTKETMLSPTATVAITLGQNISITGLPGLPSGAASINVYIGTSVSKMQLAGNTATTSITLSAAPAATAQLVPQTNFSGTPGTDSLNFTSTLKDAFGDTIVALGIKHLFILNLSASNWLLLGGSASSTFPIDGSSGPAGVNNFRLIPPGGDFDITAFGVTSGIPIVTGINDTLVVSNFATGTTQYSPIVGMNV